MANHALDFDHDKHTCKHTQTVYSGMCICYTHGSHVCVGQECWPAQGKPLGCVLFLFGFPLFALSPTPSMSPPLSSKPSTVIARMFFFSCLNTNWAHAQRAHTLTGVRGFVHIHTAQLCVCVCVCVHTHKAWFWSHALGSRHSPKPTSEGNKFRLGLACWDFHCRLTRVVLM